MSDNEREHLLGKRGFRHQSVLILYFLDWAGGKKMETHYNAASSSAVGDFTNCENIVH